MSRNAQLLFVAAAVVVCLLPFAGKAFHIDDPLFLWMAEQIRDEPLDPYGFTVNWYGFEQPASTVIKNPPGGAYFIAVVSAVFGAGELPVHLAFLLPALGVVLGTFLLASELGADGLTASLIALLNPLFLVSATQVMCDVPMLCLWVWCVVCWVVGLKRNDSRLLLLSAVLLAACALTKYFGMSLIALLLVYGVTRKRALGAWMAFLLVPCAIFGLYQVWTTSIYGRGLLFDAADYARNARLLTDPRWMEKTLTGLAFVGGGLTSMLVLAPRLWSKRTLLASGGVAVAVTLLLPLVGTLGNLVLRDDAGTHWGATVQVVIFALLGAAWLALAASELRDKPDADTLLLVLWLFGTFVFAAFVNWSLNGRSVLPLVPAAGILAARRLGPASRMTWRTAGSLAVAMALALALVPAWTDYRLANSARTAATRIMEGLRDETATVWFMGHWGFQYYMQVRGARPMAMDRSEIGLGDVLAMPSNNTNLFEFPAEALSEPRVVSEVPSRWISTMHFGRAGFYSDGWGPLPYAIGPVPPETYRVQRLVRSVRSRTGR